MTPLVAALVLSVQSGPIDTVFLKRSWTCGSVALAANAYIDMGEERAVADLTVRGGRGQKLDYMPMATAVRACHLCRVLFTGRNGKALRAPKLGVIRLPHRSMPLSSWPEFPMAQQDGVWFELGNAYLLSGKAETVEQYVDYCRKNGAFRKEKLTVPDENTARAALKELLASDRWGKVQWSGGGVGESYDYPKEGTFEFLRNQTHFD
ncbi:MAG: hypothetical protein JST30_12275 [Armatimonadetes bacterium]|nr:hypothetical protein [Armatimonadota bacterium]